MKEPQFTPGPWEPGRNPAMATVLDGHEGKAIYPKGANRHIAWANVYDEEGELCMNEALANAALIAAAPEMYKELESTATILNALADQLEDQTRHDDLEDLPDDMLSAAEGMRVHAAVISELLAQARGEVVEK